MATPEAMPTPAPHPLEHPDRPRAHRHSIPRTAPGSAAAASHTAPDHGVAGRQPNSGAHYLSNPKPEYPEKARALHQQGVVLLGVEVGADGRPSEVTITRSSGFPELDQAAVRAVRRWTFEPARAGGLPVSSRVVVPVHFSLED
jgi:protein TonB